MLEKRKLPDTLLTSVYFNKYSSYWINGYIVEYRAPYESELKLCNRIWRPTNTEMNELIVWFKNNMQGSWKVITDMAIFPDGTYKIFDKAFKLLVSREEDLIHYKLTWM